MLIPHFLLQGDGAEQHVGLGKKLVNQMSKSGVRSKTLQVGDATIHAQQFGNIGKVRINAISTAPVVVKNFDSAIIRYTWFNASGEDLDTVTYISKPNFRSDAVGWVTDNDTTPISATGMNDSYLFWNGDNVSDVGSEAILVSFKKLIDDFPELSEIAFAMYATWYSYKGNGKILLQFETYKGGTFTGVGYDIVNSGGELIQRFDKPVVVDLFQPSANPGQLVGTLVYTRATDSFTLS